MIVALEGIDASGKQTQGGLLAERLADRGLETARIAFPRYGETHFAASIERYLAGGFGSLEAVAPEFAALLFAGDRLESRDMLLEAREDADVLLLDRYVASNMAHQGARVAAEHRGAFLGWLARVEHGVYRLPEADLTVFLDVPVEIASRLAAERREKSGGEALDLHERNRAYLEACRAVYLELAEMGAGGRWVRVPCVTGDRDELDPPEQIAERVWQTVEPMLFLAG